jgi:hypothetical protein
MISEKEVIDVADDYLLTYVGNLVASGIPFFNSKERVWIVPIFNVSSNKTFPLDEMKLSENGAIVYAPSRERLIELSKGLTKTPVVHQY